MVQGVFYRAWTERNARELGLDGSVRNSLDGSVEAVFSGPANYVEEMLERCLAGPPDAMVNAVIVLHEGGSVPPGEWHQYGRTAFGQKLVLSIGRGAI